MIEKYFIVLHNSRFINIDRLYAVCPGKYLFKNKFAERIWRLRMKFLGYIIIDEYKDKPLTQNMVLDIAKVYDYWDETYMKLDIKES